MDGQCTILCFLMIGLFCFTLQPIQGRQMCLSCQYQTPQESGAPCINDPWNWPGGQVRLRCPHRCSFQTRRNIETDTITYAYRGCTRYGDDQENGCYEQSGEQLCYVTCVDVDYCNDWNATDIVSSAVTSRLSLFSVLALTFVLFFPGWMLS